MTNPMLDTPDNRDVDETSDEMPSLVGQLLSGRYRIEAELGVGGMGAVYRAEHTLMRKRMAVKVLHPEMTRLPEVVERFEREAMAAAHIEHPNVAAATDFGKLEDGSFFLVLEYVEGDSLRDVLEDGPMDPNRVIHIGRQIVAGLVRAHGLGIVHRDLKPENVMLVNRDGDTDFVKVLDFGIAKVPVSEISKEAGKQHSKTLTKVGMVYGTPEYMAPEQALGQDVDARADLYALGVILYEMLVGRRPFESDSPVTLLGMQVTAAPPPFRDVAPELSIPIELETVVMELLEKEAARRPADAKQVRDAFIFLEQAFGDGSPISLEQSGMVRAVTGIASAPFVPGEQSNANIVVKADPMEDIKERVSDGIEKVQRAVRPSRIRRLEAELRKHLPKPLQPLPLVAWVGGAAAAGLLAVSFGGLLLWWANTPNDAESAFENDNWPPSAMSSVVEQAAAAASPEEVAQAKKGGREALEALFVKYPNDAQVLEPLATLRMQGAAPISSVELYKKLFAIAPDKVRDEQIADQLVKAAGVLKSQDAAFEVLEKHMGSEGPDILYDMVFGNRAGANKLATTRASKSVRSDAVKKKASPAMAVALDLRFTGGCQGKHALLDRAKQYGDDRSLAQLRGLLHAKGCGFLGLSDCWKCMRSDRKLSDAVAAITKREKADSAAPSSSADK